MATDPSKGRVTQQELEQQMKFLINEVVRANSIYKLFMNLRNALTNEYATEFQQSSYFWNATLRSLMDQAFLIICRVYDGDPSSLGLNRLIASIRGSIGLFEETEFRQRMADSSYVDSLAKGRQLPNREGFRRDEIKTSHNDPIVKKLIDWRRKRVAHNDYNVVTGADDALSHSPISHEEFQTLIDRAFEIYNRYSSLYNASTYAKIVVGENDYTFMLKLLRIGLQKHQDDIDAELGSDGSDSGV